MAKSSDNNIIWLALGAALLYAYSKRQAVAMPAPTPAGGLRIFNTGMPDTAIVYDADSIRLPRYSVKPNYLGPPQPIDPKYN